MNNGRMPSGNKNTQGRAPSSVPQKRPDLRSDPRQNQRPVNANAAQKRPQNPSNTAQRRPADARNATQKNAQSPRVAPQAQRPIQKRPEPNVSFAATPKKSAPIPPKKLLNAAQKIHVAPPKIEPRVNEKIPPVQEEKPRRRNDESYVFSRSLSETRERILEERRERLEDAEKFKKEDVRIKLRAGIISFIAVLLLISIIASIAISCSLGQAKPKKSKGDYVYTIGTKKFEITYAEAVKNDTFYISMNDVAELCDMTLSGSATAELRFTAKNGDWISFAPSSNVARINGYSISMPAPAYIQDTKCSVPLEFLDLVVSGISISIDLDNKEVKLLRDEYSDSTRLEPHYVEISFALKTDSILAPLDENKYFAGQPLFTFKTDLTAYEKYMNPTGDSKNDFLILLNKENPCDSDFVPKNIVVIPSKWVVPSKANDVELELNETAEKALEAMLLELRAEGFNDVYVTSAYRPYSYQETLYYNVYIPREMNTLSADAYAVLGSAYIKENYVDKGLTGLSREDATTVVNSYSAIPGYSEHHTGLCVDLITTDMTDLTNAFADKEIYDWLSANAWKFGFILRYPEDKVDVTGYSYESWHWRFVGRDVALEMLRTGECFEEYLARTSVTE